MARSYLRTRECAALLGVQTRYIWDEVNAGRLDAEVIVRPPAIGRRRGNRVIRIYPDAWRAYVERYWPDVFHEEQQSA